MSRHLIHIVGKSLPCTFNTDNESLSAQLSAGTDVQGDPRDLLGEVPELIYHGVYRVLQV